MSAEPPELRDAALTDPTTAAICTALENYLRYVAGVLVASMLKPPPKPVRSVGGYCGP